MGVPRALGGVETGGEAATVLEEIGLNGGRTSSSPRSRRPSPSLQVSITSITADDASQSWQCYVISQFIVLKLNKYF